MRNGKPSYSPIGDEKTFSTDFLADKTIEFIDKHKDGPFCYMTSIPDPHGPDTVRAPYDTMYADMTFEKPRTYDRPQQGLPHWARAENCRYEQAKYFGMVRCIDDNVGKILRYLRENKLLDKTITIFTSDHGDLRGEHHRHNKGVPMEASAKIPFVIRWPAKIRAGTIVKQALGTVDFMPTILALMGFKGSGREEGRDASALLTTGKAPEGWKDVTVVRGTGDISNWIGAFTGRYKLIVSPKANPWLVDMEKDPDEMKNFLSDSGCRDVLRDLAKELIDYGEKYKDARIGDAKVKADLEWCIKGEGDYVPKDFPEPVNKGRKKKTRKKARKKKTEQ
jgi:arylsulfatase A-like enzyme